MDNIKFKQIELNPLNTWGQSQGQSINIVFYPNLYHFSLLLAYLYIVFYKFEVVGGFFSVSGSDKKNNDEM